jgi:hypothetical protein
MGGDFAFSIGERLWCSQKQPGSSAAAVVTKTACEVIDRRAVGQVGSTRLILSQNRCSVLQLLQLLTPTSPLPHRTPHSKS